MLYLILICLFLLSTLSVGLLLLRYKSIGRLDNPNDRSMHTLATPTGAGLAVIGLFVLVGLYLYATSREAVLLIILSILLILMITGWFDDKNNLSVKLRLGVFCIVSAILVFAIGPVDEIILFNSTDVSPPYWLAIVITSLGFIWLINLYNFMDGMDGLAGLQAIIASLTFAFLFYKIDPVFGTNLYLLCLALAVITLGFMFWNWSPAKIFLGDVGSLPIGAFFGVLSVIAVREYDVSIFSCVLVLFVFVFDTFYTLVLRAIRGENLTQAHSSHLYQRLGKAGVAHYKVVLAYGVLMSYFAGLAILFELSINTAVVTGVFVVIGVISALITFKKIILKLN